jgi:hypothetical protein
MTKRNSTINKKIVQIVAITFFIFYITISCVQAQSTSSPYSRYGIGDLNAKSNAQSFSMGGTCIAMQNDSFPIFNINNSNPASYSNMRLTTAELGLNYTRVQLQSATDKQSINNASLKYFEIAFPIYRRSWGMSFGLVPFSSVGYKVIDHETNMAGIGNADFLYQGTGGVNQLYLGTGFKPLFNLPRMFGKSEKLHRLYDTKFPTGMIKPDSVLKADHLKIRKILKRKKALQDISVGANASYLFGSINNQREAILPYGNNSFNTQVNTSTRFSDIYFDYGAQYCYTIDTFRGRDLKQNVQWLIGVNFAAQTNVRAKIDSLSYTYYTNSQGYPSLKDTIESTSNTHGTVTFPLSIGIGLGFKKGERWYVSADYAMQNWSSYSSFNQSGGLKNSMRASFGIQFVPNAAASGEYMKHINYRVGARYAQTALELYSTQLTEQAVSVGIGFPVGRNNQWKTYSMLNLGFEYGYRGTTDNGLIRENFYRFTIGFSINDLWFFKPKID